MWLAGRNLTGRGLTQVAARPLGSYRLSYSPVKDPSIYNLSSDPLKIFSDAEHTIWLTRLFHLLTILSLNKCCRRSSLVLLLFSFNECGQNCVMFATECITGSILHSPSLFPLLPSNFYLLRHFPSPFTQPTLPMPLHLSRFLSSPNCRRGNNNIGELNLRQPGRFSHSHSSVLEISIIVW